MNEISIESVLLEIYENALEEFKKSGYHPHPANLLAMLLLSEKDKFEPLQVSEGEFYQEYKSEIDSKIEKVIKDFRISKQEIKAFIEANGILVTDFETDKIWFAFADGFGIMHGEMMYRPNQTDYQMYSCMDNKSKWYKMTKYGLEEYSPKNKNRILTKVDKRKSVNI